MDDIYYIEEIQYWINNLKDELKYAESSINNHGVDYLRKFINNRCNNIELYARALRDKLNDLEFRWLPVENVDMLINDEPEMTLRIE